MNAPERMEIRAEEAAELPQSRPYVDPDGRTRRFDMDVAPGRPAASVDECREEPQSILRVRPDYPQNAAIISDDAAPMAFLVPQPGQEGDVTIEFTIARNGGVKDARVVESTNAFFDDAALAVANVYRFSAALNRDKKVPVWVSFPITFQVR